MKPAKNMYASYPNVLNIKANTGRFMNTLDLTRATVECKGATFENFELDLLSVDTITEKTLNAGVNIDGVLIKDSLVDGVALALFKADYDSKVNQAVLTSSTPSFTNIYLSQFGTSAGFVKRLSSGLMTIDTGSYESPLTFSAPLLRSLNNISLDTALPITQITNLTTAGFVKTDSKGNTSVDTNTYLTANETITLSGDVSGSGTTAITTTIGALKVLNSMLAGSITASKLVLTDITTLLNLVSIGTITTGVWNGTSISTTYGGTGISGGYTSGQLLIGNVGGTLTAATLTSASANQISITNGSGSITIGTPQDIGLTSSPQFAKVSLQAANTATSAIFTSNPTLTDQTGLIIQPYYDATYYDATRLFFKQTTDNKNGFSIGSSGSGTSSVLNWQTDTFNISRHDGSSAGATSLTIAKAGGMTINEDLLLDNTSTTFNGAVNVGGLSINTLVATDGSGAGRLTTSVSGLSPAFTGLSLSGLSASSLCATDSKKNLTSTVSGLSPGFTGLSLSGLTASTLVATDGSKNLTSTTTGITPTFAGLITTGDRKTYNNFNTKYYSNAGITQIGAVGVANTTTVFDMALVSTSGWLRIGAPSAGTIAFWTDGNTGVNALPQFRMSGSTFGVYTSAGALNGTIAPSGTDFLITAAGGLRLYGTNGNILLSPNGTNYVWINNTQMFPHADNVYSNGLAANRWANVYSTLGNFSSTLSVADGSVSTPGINFGSDTNSGIYRIGNDNIGIACNGTKLIDILSAGNTQPIQPSFNAYPSVDLSSQTGDNTSYTIVWNSENHDAGSNYATGTGFFTAPVAGRYHFSCTVNLIGLTSSHTKADLLLNDGTLTYARTIINPWAIRSGDNTVSISVNTTVQLSASANMRMILNVSGGTKVVGVAGGRSLSWFCGQLLS